MKKRIRLTTREPHSSYRDRFTEGEQIGTGGMGEVVAVVDKYLGRSLALKRISAEHKGRILRELSQRLREEAQIMAQLDHPGVVPVHEIGVDDRGRLYFTMTLVEGTSLRERIAVPPSKRGPSDRFGAAPSPEADARRKLRELLQIVLKICDAVAYAHALGVVHRDLKPDNVLLGRYGEVYVMDWGIAKLEEERAIDKAIPTIDQGGAYPYIQEHGRIFGTYGYMAPEQVEGDPSKIDVRADVFGVGAILYEIVSGQAPFDDPNERQALLRSGLVNPVIPFEQIPAHGRLREIISRALAREPKRRYPSIKALKQDLESFLDCGWSFERHRFKKGAVIIEEGAASEQAFIIVEGRCSVYKLASGKQQHLRDMGPGEVFGETGVFAGSSRTARVIATTDVTVAALGRDDLERDLKDGSWVSLIVRALAQRFIEKDQRVTQLELELSRLKRPRR